MNQPVRTTDLADLADLTPVRAVGDRGPRRPLELRMVLRILWQRRGVALFCLLLTLAAAWVLLGRIAPHYTATTEVMLNSRETKIIKLDRVVGNLGHDASANEQRVLGSERLLRRVIRRLRLDRDPEFNEALRTPSPARRWWADLRRRFGGAPSTGRVAAPVVIEDLRRALDVRGVPFTRSITISVTSVDPAKAALIANTLADLYIVDQLETKFEATRRASAWLNDRLRQLKRKVEISEARVVRFKARQESGQGQGRDLTARQIAELNTALITARAARAAAEARAAELERRLKKGGLAAAARVVSSELILTLRTKLAELVRRNAELSTRYGVRHPRIIDVRAEIADARAAIRGEVRKIIEGRRNDVAVARARETALKDSLAELEAKRVAFTKSSVGLRQLEREAAADRRIYESFLGRFRETTEQEDLQSADARILSAASVPIRPSSPDARKVLLVATAIGIALALAVIALLETLAGTFRAAPEITGQTGLPVLATLPVRGRRRPRRKLLEYVRQRPNSALAEAVRALRTALLVSTAGSPPQVVMVTSSMPGEGKSTTSLMLAHLSQQMNRRAIVIDCDIRLPTVHESFDLPATSGLIALLEGKAELGEAIATDRATGLDVLPSRRPAPEAADALSSERFKRLIAVLREHYDLIVLDTPPVLLVSDAAAIGTTADAAIYAVRWGRTPRDAVAQGLGLLRDRGVAVAGCILTMADANQAARHGYARYGDGYGYYAGARRYYVN